MSTESTETIPERIIVTEPEGEASQSWELQAARALINQIAAIERLLQIYKPNNAAVTQAGDSLMATLDRLFENQQTVDLRFWRDCIFVNGDRLRCDVSNFTAHKYLLGRTSRLGIEKIILEAGIDRAEALEFFCLLDRLDSDGVRGSGICQHLATEDQEHITVIPATKKPKELEDLGIKALSSEERAKQAFYATLGSVKEVLVSQTSQGVVSMKKAKRAVQAAADALLDDESSMLALATIKDHDEYTFTHSVNVCIFSLAIGQRLGLHRSWLARLGIAALFHDIGKVSIPRQVLNKIGALDVDEWQAIRKHTLMGVRKLSRMPRCNEHVLHSMIVACQHHINMDLSGYPTVPSDTTLDLFSRIVRIADTFDAMTTERPYRNKVYSPHEAIRYLLSQAGPKFDPVLVKAFASAMGIFPIGTVLRLNTGEIGIVVRRSELTGEPDRPMVRILIDSDGNQVTGQRLLDLGTVDPDTGDFVYSVVDALSCQDVGVDPRDYLLLKQSETP